MPRQDGESKRPRGAKAGVGSGNNKREEGTDGSRSQWHRNAYTLPFPIPYSRSSFPLYNFRTRRRG